MTPEFLNSDDAISLADARAYIEQLDLSYVIDAMCSDSYPLPRWTIENAKHCCRLYKNFLILLKIHQAEALVPSRDIDEFWHNHILHTKQYMHDCQSIFGYYFHHMPAKPEDDLKTLTDQYLKTKDYYLKEFNAPLTLLMPVNHSAE